MIAVFHRSSLAPLLTPIERTELARLGLTGPRAAEWIAGRSALHRVLGPSASVISDADGAPHVVGGGVHVSLSHDADWVAVAVGSQPVAIDVCASVHRPRLARIVARLDVAGIDPLLAWAALECALKLRRRGIWTLLDTALAVRGDGASAWVEGIGAPVRVAWCCNDDYALVWANASEAPTWGNGRGRGIGDEAVARRAARGRG